MLALEVCKLDSLSIQNAQELILQPQCCKLCSSPEHSGFSRQRPVWSPVAPERQHCLERLPPISGGEPLGFCGNAQQLPNLVSWCWLVLLFCCWFFFFFKHKIEAWSAADLTWMRYAVNILPHLSTVFASALSAHNFYWSKRRRRRLLVYNCSLGEEQSSLRKMSVPPGAGAWRLCCCPAGWVDKCSAHQPLWLMQISWKKAVVALCVWLRFGSVTGSSSFQAD